MSRLGEIAGTAATGALTGGLTLAGQALFTGGLSSLTAEAIAGSIIGGGVGAGVNDALGGGQIAQVLAGIAGSAATTGAISKYRQRQARQQQAVNETTPLLNGLGRGDEHFVPLKLKQLNKVDHDLIRRQQEKFNRNLGQIEEDVDGTFIRQPERPPQESILNKVKKISARKAREATTQMQQLGSTISEGASNIRQRLTGRNNDGRGNYSQVPNVDDRGDYSRSQYPIVNDSDSYRSNSRGYSQVSNVDDDVSNVDALGQQIRANPSMSREYWGNSDERNAQLKNYVWHNDMTKTVENGAITKLQGVSKRIKPERMWRWKKDLERQAEADKKFESTVRFKTEPKSDLLENRSIHPHDIDDGSMVSFSAL